MEDWCKHDPYLVFAVLHCVSKGAKHSVGTDCSKRKASIPCFQKKATVSLAMPVANKCKSAH